MRKSLTDNEDISETMTKTLSRGEAMELLAVFELRQKDKKWRDEELSTIASEDWEDDDLWRALPEPLREEVRNHRNHAPVISDPEHRRFDKILMLSLRHIYVGSTNDFIADALWCFGHGDCVIVGDIELLVACPCCGYRTLGNRGHYDICPICWWEDDGQDNENSNIVSGPNRCSLKQGRINYIREGIAKPNREDLIKLQSSKEQYPKERKFVIRDRKILEIDADWCEPL